MLLAAAAPFAHAVNAIINNTFASGTENWSLKVASGYSASLDTSAGWGRVTITNGGSSKSYVNLEQNLNQPLQNGGVYTIAFDARASAAKSIDVLLRSDSAIYTASYGVNVTTATSRVTLTYTHSGADANNARLSLRIGGSLTTLYIDNVVVARQGAASQLLSNNNGVWQFNSLTLGGQPWTLGAFDFSYAGYRYGEREDFVGIPPNVQTISAVDDEDITEKIKTALTNLPSGGTVVIPRGTFRIGKNKTGKAIIVSTDNTVIKGAGIGLTTLIVDASYHALALPETLSNLTSASFGNAVITFERGSGSSWYDGSTATNVATVPNAISLGDRTITVYDPSNTLASASTVVIRQIMSQTFNETYAYAGGNLKPWRWSNYVKDGDTYPVNPDTGKCYPLFSDGSFSFSYYRNIVSRSSNGSTVTLDLDVPIPHALQPADSTHLPITVSKKSTPLLTNCGLQDLTFTAEAETGPAATDSAGATVLASGLYHGLFKNINVESFRTLGLATAYPVNVSYLNCRTANALNVGGGGSGYGFYIKGQNLLYKDCHAYYLRHGFTTAASQTCNVVLKNCLSQSYHYLTSGESVDDTHLQFAHGILYDNHYSDEAGLLNVNRAEQSLQAWETCGWSIHWNYENAGNNTKVLYKGSYSDVRHNLLGITPAEKGMVIGAHSAPGLGLLGVHDSTNHGIRVADGYTRIHGDNQTYDDWGTGIMSSALQVGPISNRVLFENTGQPVAESIYEIMFAKRAKMLPVILLMGLEQPSGTPLTDGASAINYGSMNVGSSSTKTFVIRNNGATAITLGGATIDGANASQFSVMTVPTGTLAPGASASFIVAFSPAVVGNGIATLHVVGSDPTLSTVFLATLQGTGL